MPKGRFTLHASPFRHRVFDKPYLLTVHTVRRVFDGPSLFSSFERTTEVRCRLYVLYCEIALLLDDEEQFQSERVSTERHMWVHFCLRNIKTEREF
jgi:hypothetical protein